MDALLPPAKRARVGHSLWDDDDEEADQDELILSASQFDARQHPMYQLDKKRAQSAFKLKSRFEDIFEKYSKDFEGVADEIDLRTGEVVVNNGHLQSLQDEDQDKSEDEEEEARLLQDQIKAKANTARIKQISSAQTRTSHFVAPHLLQQNWPNALRIIPNGPSSMQTSRASQPLYLGNAVAEPAWQIPEASTPLQSLSPCVLPFNNGPQPFMPMTSVAGFELPSMLAQPYRRIATAKDIGPRITVPSDIATEDHEGDLVVDEGADQDVLVKMVKDSTDDSPRQRTKKQYSAIIPFKGLATGARDCAAESTVEVNVETTVAASSKSLPRRRTRKQKHPTPFESLVIPVADQGPASPTVCDPGSGLSGLLLGSTEHGRSPYDTNASDEMHGATQEMSATRAWFQEQTPITDDSSDSQSRRSGRLRKQVDHYSHITWKDQRRRRTSSNAVTPPPERNTTWCVELRSAPKRVADIQSSTSNPIECARPMVDIDNGLPVQALNASESSTLSVDTTRQIPPGPERPPSSSRRTTSDPHAPQPSSPAAKPRDERQTAEITTEQPLDGGDSSDYNVEPPSDRHSSGHQTPPTPSPEPDDPEIHVAGAEPTRSLDNIESTSNRSPSLDLQAEEEDCEMADESIELGEEFKLSSNLPDEVPDSVGEPSPEPERDSRLDVTQSELPVDFANDYGSHAGNQSFAHGHNEAKMDLPFRPPPMEDTQEHISVADASQPSPPSRRGRGRPPKSGAVSDTQPRTPKKTRKLTSLLPDLSDEEDELSILSSLVARTPTSTLSLRASFLRGVSRTPLTLTSTPRRNRQQISSLSTPRHLSLSRASSRRASPSLPRRLPATDTGAVRYGLKRKQSATNLAQSSPLARSIPFQKTPLSGESVRSSRVGSPTSSVLGTPGGSARRCGQDDYVCERNFCFTCCK